MNPLLDSDIGVLLDDLKANFRSWEIDNDNEDDANGLVLILMLRHPYLPQDVIEYWAYEWTGYEPMDILT